MNRYLSLSFCVLILSLLTACSKTSTLGSSADTGSSYPGSALSSGGSGSGSSSSSNPGNGSANQPGVITAGEWNDIDHWSFWLGLMDTAQWKAKQDYWRFYPQRLYTVELTAGNGTKVADAEISFKDAGRNVLWTAKTDNAGKAVAFPAVFSSEKGSIYTASALVNGRTIDLGIFPSSQYIEKRIDLLVAADDNVDLMYVVDATGSMGDELSYLKTELNNVLTRSKADLPGINLRMGSVFYRDQGDEYLTKIAPFTTNVGSLVNFVQQQKADGGGDFPEAVHTALQTAIEQQSWSSTARARLLFLVLDAPPHHEDAVIQSLQVSIRKAAQKGIKIIPVTASGIDKETEFMMRFMSIVTNGTYVFITNDSGIGNNHLSPTVGKYDVEFLNNLMVRLIKKYAKN